MAEPDSRCDRRQAQGPRRPDHRRPSRRRRPGAHARRPWRECRDDLSHQPRGDRDGRSPRSKPAGVKGLAIAADLTQPGQAENAVRQVVDRFGRLDVLVNMTSVFRRTPLGEPFGSGFRRHDRRQPRRRRFMRPSPRPGQCSPSPRDDGIKGKIVILGDWATERPYKDYLPYLVAKGASRR